MTTAPQPVDIKNLRIEPLASHESLRDFDSGEREVDRHIEKCCDWHRKYRQRVFRAFLPRGEESVAVGFYCLGISAAESKYLSEEILQTSDGQAYVPFIYINYLAVRREYQKNKIGTILLLNALERCAHTIKNIGIYGVALNAVTDRAAGLYDRYGFREYGGRSKYPFMVLPAQSLIDLFQED